MLFTSLTFLFFHLAVVALRWALPARAAGPLLLASSYVFYLSWEPKYGLLISTMTVVTWFGGRAIDARRAEGGTRAKRLLQATVGALLAVLAYFKYANFIGAQVKSALP